MRWWTLLILFVLLSGMLASASPPGYRQETLVPAQGPAYSPTEDYLKQMLAKLDSIDKRLERMEGKGAGGTQQGDALGVIAARCLACHQDGKAQDKGGEFVLVEKDGALAELSLAEKRRVVKLTGQGKMPPAQPLSDAEKKLIADYFAPKTEEKPK